MKKAIVFTALAFSAATLSAQYNINLSRVTPPSIEYLKMGNTGPKGKEIRVNNLYMDEGGINFLLWVNSITAECILTIGKMPY